MQGILYVGIRRTSMPRYLCYLCHNHSENHIYWNFIIIQAAVVFDEEEDVDDSFVPRKLFLFSFAHFKVSTEFLNYYSWLMVMVLSRLVFVSFFYILYIFFGGGWGVYLFSVKPKYFFLHHNWIVQYTFDCNNM